MPENFANISIKDLVISYELLSHPSQRVIEKRGLGRNLPNRTIEKLNHKFGNVAIRQAPNWNSTSRIFLQILEGIHRIFHSPKRQPYFELKLRDLFILSYLDDGLSIVNIADTLGVKQPNVSSLIRKYSNLKPSPLVRRESTKWVLAPETSHTMDAVRPLLKELWDYYYQDNYQQTLDIKILTDPVIFDFYPSLWTADLLTSESLKHVSFTTQQGRNQSYNNFDAIITHHEFDAPTYKMKALFSIQKWGLIYRARNLQKSIYCYPLFYCFSPVRSLLSKFEQSLELPNLRPIYDSLLSNTVVGFAPLEVCYEWQAMSGAKLEVHPVQNNKREVFFYWKVDQLNEDKEKTKVIKNISTKIANEIRSSFG